MRTNLVASVGALAAAAVLVVALAPAPAGPFVAAKTDEDHSAENVTITSFDTVAIVVTVFKPVGADADNQVPVLLHSHGWAGARWKTIDQARSYLDAGFGVVSIDMRGHGQSGGAARVHDPEFEIRDVIGVIDYVAGLDWAALDAEGDPVLGALGGSYGGGYQFLTALEETRATGSTRLNALAPEITWNDLPQSLAPNGVVRSAWIDLLYGAAKATGTRVDPMIDQAYAYSATTGQLPDGSLGSPDIATEFYEHSPASFAAQGVQLDIPVLILQGIPDTLFNLNQAVANYETVLTDAARAESVLMGHLGGHILNTDGTLGAVPAPTPVGLQPPGKGNPCVPEELADDTDLIIAWYQHHLLGEALTAVDPGILLSTDQGGCIDVGASLPAALAYDVAPLTPAGTVVSTGPGGAPVYLPVASGAGTLAGLPTFAARLTSTSADTRLFLALAVGSNAADATIVNSQWTPIRVAGPAADVTVETDLAGVGIEIGAGQTVFLVVSPFADQFAHHGSRVAGAVTLSDIVVGLPQA